VCIDERERALEAARADAEEVGGELEAEAAAVEAGREIAERCGREVGGEGR